MKATTRSALAAGLLVLLLPAFAQQSDRAKRLGARLWCMCGCHQILTQCNHVGCSTSTEMLKKLDAVVARNDPDDLTIQSFVQEYGPQVLAQPPAKGLALMAYVLPGVALLAGLAIVWVVIQHWRRTSLAAAHVVPAPKIPREVLERARRQADVETDWDEAPGPGIGSSGKT